MSSIQIIKTLYKAFKRKDNELFRKICDEDIEWIQNKGFPNGGHYHGADAVIQKVFQRLNDDWQDFKFKIEDMYEVKDSSKVFVIGTYIGKHKQTQKKIDASAVHFYEIENQRVKRFRQFTDTAVIVAAIES